MLTFARLGPKETAGVVRFGRAGIYLTKGTYVGFADGLWLMDPVSGASRQLAPTGYPEGVSDDGTVWLGRINPNDPRPHLVIDAGNAPDEIDRLDPSTGQTVAWLYRPGEALWLIGFDYSGRLLVIDERGTEGTAEAVPFMLEVVLSPNHTRTLLTYLPQVNEGPSVITDDRGTWVGGEPGVFLYSQDGSFRKVASVFGRPVGPCR